MQVQPRVLMRSVTKSTDRVHLATISTGDLKSLSTSTETSRFHTSAKKSYVKLSSCNSRPEVLSFTYDSDHTSRRLYGNVRLTVTNGVIREAQHSSASAIEISRSRK